MDVLGYGYEQIVDTFTHCRQQPSYHRGFNEPVQWYEGFCLEYIPMKYERGSFITVPSREVLRGLHPTAQTLYMWLCSYANETSNCFPSRATLANDAGCSESMVDNMLNLLEEKGLLRKKGRKDGDRQLSNLYTVLVGTLPHSGTPPPTQYATPLPRRTHELNPSLTQSYEVVADATEREVPLKRKKKTTPEMQSIFDVFADNPARFQWRLYENEREAAAILAREYGVEKVRKQYEYVRKHRDEHMAPQAFTPSQLLEKIPRIKSFSKRV